MTENGGELVFMFRGEITEFQFYQNRKAEKLIMMPFCQEDLEMHGHNFFELAYITGGTAEHTLENEGKTISAGDYFFVDYGCLHGFQNCKNLTLINCLFLPETVDETLQGCRSFSKLLQGCLLKYYRMSLGQAKFARVFHDRDGQVGQLMQEMLLEYQEQKVGCYPLLRFKLLEILLLTAAAADRTGKRAPLQYVCAGGAGICKRELSGQPDAGNIL